MEPDDERDDYTGPEPLSDVLERYWQGNPRALAWAEMSHGAALEGRDLEMAQMHQLTVEATCPQWFRPSKR